jgi:hypothetical protein
MANTTIPMLPQATGLSGTEQIEIVQSGSSVRATLNQVANLGGPTGPPGLGPTGPTGPVGPSGSGELALYVAPSGDTSGITDTANLQAALNTLGGDSSGNFRKLTIYGQYYTGESLVLPLSGASIIQQQPLQIIGYGQTAINTVAGATNFVGLEVQTPPGSNCHGLSFDNFAILSKTQNTDSNTSSAAIGFRSTDGTSNGTIFEIFFDRIYVQGFRRGVANTQVSGQYATWGMKFSRCIFGSMSGAATWLASPVSIGQPNINFDHIYSTEFVGGTEGLFVVDGCDSLWFNNVETNNLTNRSQFRITSSFYSLNRSKLETSTYSINTNPVISTANSTGTIRGYLFSNPALTATNLVLIEQNVGSVNNKITIDDLTIEGGTGTGTLTCIEGSGVGKYLLNVSPDVTTLGSGPMTVRLNNSGSSAVSNLINFAAPPGGGMSDDMGQTSITTFNPLTTPQTSVWNTALAGNITVNLAAAGGSTVADNSWDGATFTFVLTANATIGGNTFTITAANPTSQTLTAGQFATYQYRRSFGGYVQTAFGSL